MGTDLVGLGFLLQATQAYVLSCVNTRELIRVEWTMLVLFASSVGSVASLLPTSLSSFNVRIHRTRLLCVLPVNICSSLLASCSFMFVFLSSLCRAGRRGNRIIFE